MLFSKWSSLRSQVEMDEPHPRWGVALHPAKGEIAPDGLAVIHVLGGRGPVGLSVSEAQKVIHAFLGPAAG